MDLYRVSAAEEYDDDVAPQQEASLLQQNICHVLDAQNANTDEKDLIALFSNEQWWAGFCQAMLSSKYYKHARRKKDVLEMGNIFRGKVTEVTGQTLLKNALNTWNIHDDPSALEGLDDDIVPVGKSHWRFQGNMNIEIYYSKRTARSRTAEQCAGEMDMAVATSDGTDVCFVDFSASLGTIHRKAQDEVLRFMLIQDLCHQNTLRMSKLHIAFSPGVTAALPQSLIWQGLPIEDCHFADVSGAHIVDHVFGAALHAWETDMSFETFRRTLHMGVH